LADPIGELIVIADTGSDLSAKVGPIFGRCPLSDI